MPLPLVVVVVVVGACCGSVRPAAAAAARLSALGRTLVVEASPEAGQGAFLFPRSETEIDSFWLLLCSIAV